MSHWKEAYKNSLVLSAFQESLESVPNLFSNFLAFYRLTAAGFVSVLSSVNHLVIQA
jgi:hypothetical protein